MPRVSQADTKRRELLPVVAGAFAELGYRRVTTAELAERCGVRENILYRLWADKKAMFIAAIEYVYDLSEKIWADLFGQKPTGSSAERLIEYESKHLGEFGHSRIIFAGLSEADDPDIRKALARMYARYQRFVLEQVTAHRDAHKPAGKADAGLAAWALVGLGTVVTITKELGLLKERDRAHLLAEIGRRLLD